SRDDCRHRGAVAPGPGSTAARAITRTRTQEDRMDFAGRTVIVTGAASGAGKVTALAFGDAGASVALLDLDDEGAAAVADQIDGNGERAIVWKVDMAIAADVRAAVRGVHERFGRLHAVANVAGIYPKATVPEITEEFWDVIQDIDLRGVFFCCQE